MDITKKIEDFVSKSDTGLNESFRIGYENLEQVIPNIEENSVEQINEFEGTISIIGIILGAPSIIKNLAKAIGFLYKKIKKILGKEEESKAVEKIVNLSEKWKDLYIKSIRKILQAGNVFKSAGIDKDKERQATEAVFYTVIFGFAIYGGVISVQTIYNFIEDEGEMEHLQKGTIKSIISSIRAKEVKDFITKLF